jgi:hypothetical protein
LTKASPLPSRERLEELFSYDPETGIVLHRVHTWPKRIGKAAGFLDYYGYLNVQVDNRMYKLHRIIWKLVTGADPKQHIDHVDGNPNNNKLMNLREATNSQNQHNTRMSKNNTSGYKGVYLQDNLWAACIEANGIRYRKRGFNTAQEAYVWRCKRLGNLHGEFASA